MNKNDPCFGKSVLLNQRTRKLLDKGHGAIQSAPSADIRNLLVELLTHQIELERRNDELHKEMLKLERGRKKYIELFDLAPVGYLAMGEKGTILEANPVGAAMLGVEKEGLRGQSFTAFIAGDCKDDFIRFRRRLVENRRRRTRELKLEKADGNQFYASLDCRAARNKAGDVRRIHVVFSDVTHRKKKDEERRKEKKLESIGALAGGLAHDYNNLLSAIMGYISLTMYHVRDGHEISEYLNQAEKASRRAKELTRELITFSNGGKPIKKTGSMAEVLRESARYSREGSRVTWDFFTPPEPWPVDFDEDQMKRAVNNIMVNAVESMPDGGSIIARMENREAGAGDWRGRPGVEKYVKITIEDHGFGIPEENLFMIFDPYFSTKTRGARKGMGMGLAIAWSIIKKHDGHIRVESRVGVGSTFIIQLPASEKSAALFEAAKKRAPRTRENGEGKILVLEDEPMLGTLVKQMLDRFGRQAELALNGAEAIELYKMAMDSGDPFDAVILDLTVKGGMGGKTAIRKLLEVDPHVKAIVSSGYSNDPVMTEYRRYGFGEALLKPYTMEELRRTLDKVQGVKMETPAVGRDDAEAPYAADR